MSEIRYQNSLHALILIMKKSPIRLIYSLIKLTTHSWSQILVVSKCMLIVFKPSFEVVKEGRILKNSFDDRENYKISSQE